MKIPTVVAIGVDICRVSRFERLLAKGDPFVTKLSHRILHQREQGLTTPKQFAGAWAVKEAVFKTLTRDEQLAFRFNEWYRFYLEGGKPGVAGDGVDDTFMVSISHDGDYLVATVLRQKMIDIKPN